MQCPNDSAHPVDPVLHQRRKRQFLLIVARVVIPVTCLLCRYRCPVCGKTWTKLPKGTAQHKRYVPIEMVPLGEDYLTEEAATYRTVCGTDTAKFVYGVPANASDFTPKQLERFGSCHLSHVTLYRWLGERGAEEPVKEMLLARKIRPDVCFATVAISPGKYRSERRRVVLRRCAKWLKARSFLRSKTFTDFGTG